MFETLNRNTVFKLQTVKRSHFDEEQFCCVCVEMIRDGLNTPLPA